MKVSMQTNVCYLSLVRVSTSIGTCFRFKYDVLLKFLRL